MISQISSEPKATENAVRLSTLSGIFYPKNGKELERNISTFFASTVTSVSNPYGILVPHAGYVYSGPTAACGYARISQDFAGTFLVIGPSHAGFKTCTSDLIWETPLGPVPPDTEFITALGEFIPVRNDFARIRENSLEVQMPFIHHRFPRAKVVPVLMGDQSFEGAARLSKAVISAADKTGTRPVIIASGDCSHYISAKKARKDDLTVLAAIKNLDTPAFYEALFEIQPSMCGYGCIATMVEVCKSFGAKEARVILYTTSGDVSGDLNEVVGYAAMEVV